MQGLSGTYIKLHPTQCHKGVKEWTVQAMNLVFAYGEGFPVGPVSLPLLSRGGSAATGALRQ